MLGIAPGCFRQGVGITPRRLFKLQTVKECWLKFKDQHKKEGLTGARMQMLRYIS